MITKTWKIGEYCAGGIITVNIKKYSLGTKIEVQQKEWDFSKGSRRSSDQSNAAILSTEIIDSTDGNAYSKLYDFLTEITTHYYAEEVIKWISTKTRISTSWFN